MIRYEMTAITLSSNYCGVADEAVRSNRSCISSSKAKTSDMATLFSSLCHSHILAMQTCLGLVKGKSKFWISYEQSLRRLPPQRCPYRQLS